MVRLQYDDCGWFDLARVNVFSAATCVNTPRVPATALGCEGSAYSRCHLAKPYALPKLHSDRPSLSFREASDVLAILRLFDHLSANRHLCFGKGVRAGKATTRL